MDRGFKIDRSIVNIREDAFVEYKKEIYRVTQIINFKEVVAVNVKSGRAERLLSKHVKRIPPENLEKYSQAHNDISEINDKNWKIIEERFQAIIPIQHNASRKEIETRAKKLGVHYTTLYRWYKAYVESGSIMGLLPKKEGRKKGSSFIGIEAEEIISDVIESFYLTKQRPSAEAAIRKVFAVCQERNISAPSKNTIRNRISRLDEYQHLKLRYDKGTARDRFKPSPGHFEATYPLEIVQIDHTKVDIILVNEEHRKPIGRPWLTLAIDINSRIIHGYYLSMEAPSATSVAMCIVNAATPKDKLLLNNDIEAEWNVWGFMDTIHTDNGADFRSDTLTRACLLHNIKLNYRPVGQSNFGGHIERALGTIMKESHYLPGTTYSNTKEKQKYDSDAESSMTFKEFEIWLLTFITKLYHKRKHTSLGMSPEKKFLEGIFGTKDKEGIGFPPKPSDAQSILIDFLPVFHRTVQRNGINLDGLNYYDASLRSFIHATDESGKKKKFLIKRDPKDLSRIWFYDDMEQRYYEIPLANQSIPQMTLWEYNEVKRHLREKGRGQIDNREIIVVYEELHAQAQKAASNTKKKRRQMERKKIAQQQIEQIYSRPKVKMVNTPVFVDDDMWDDEIPDFEIE